MDNSLKNSVSKDIYDLWTDMLKRLAPDGRTQRISVLVAGMLQYAYSLSFDKKRFSTEKGFGDLLLEAIEMGYEDTEEFLTPILCDFFKDAKVRWNKTNSRGQSYSLISASASEFYRWHDMPWE